MRHYRRGEHGKTSLKMKRIKNIAATLHQTQSGTSHGGKCDHTQAFSNTESHHLFRRAGQLYGNDL